METRNRLSAKDILNHRFKKDVKGYDAYEVDVFLDEIIKDYQEFEALLEEGKDGASKKDEQLLALQDEIRALREGLSKMAEAKRELEIKNASMENRLGAIKPGDTPTSENLSLLRKCRAYEEFLYSHGYDPKDIASGIKK